MIGFEPLKIELEILSPIVQGGGYPIHLDSLVYWSLINFGMDHDSAINELENIFSQSNGIYHASQALFVKSANSTVIATEVVRLTKFEWADYSGQFTKSKKSIKENEGEFRKQFAEKHAIRTNKIVFFAHGDKAKIYFYLNSLVGIGKWANAGFGEIDKITITQMIEDNSWFYNDKLNRILPTYIFVMQRNEPVRQCRYKPNYSEGESMNCYIPTMNTISI